MCLRRRACAAIVTVSPNVTAKTFVLQAMLNLPFSLSDVTSVLIKQTTALAITATTEESCSIATLILRHCNYFRADLRRFD